MLPPGGWWLEAGLYRSALISEIAGMRLPQDNWQSQALLSVSYSLPLHVVHDLPVREARILWQHSERHVARKRAAGRHYLYRAGRRADGDGRRDQRRRLDSERGRSAVKGDAGGARQIGSQNLDCRAQLAGVGQRLDKRPQTCGEAEDCPIPAVPAHGRCPVEVTFGGLDQPGGFLTVPATTLGAEFV